MSWFFYERIVVLLTHDSIVHLVLLKPMSLLFYAALLMLLQVYLPLLQSLLCTKISSCLTSM